MINSEQENINPNMKRVERILSSVYNVPTVPQIILEVSNLIEDPKTSASILGRMISNELSFINLKRIMGGL